MNQQALQVLHYSYSTSYQAGRLVSVITWLLRGFSRDRTAVIAGSNFSARGILFHVLGAVPPAGVAELVREFCFSRIGSCILIVS